MDATTPAKDPLGNTPLIWTGAHPCELPLPPLILAGRGLMPCRPQKTELASSEETQLGRGNPSGPKMSLPLPSRCSPQKMLRSERHCHGPGAEPQESLGSTQIKGRPGHAIRPALS